MDQPQARDEFLKKVAKGGDVFKAALASHTNRTQYLQIASTLYDIEKGQLRRVIDLRLLQRGALLAQDRENLPDPVADDDDLESSNTQNTEIMLVPSPTIRPNLVTHSDAPESSKIKGKGGLLAQGPTDRPSFVPHSSDTGASNKQSIQSTLTEADKILTSDEKIALDLEGRNSFRSLPKYLKILLVTCAIGAVVQGWSQESIVGANLRWPIDLHIATLVDGHVQFNEPHGLKYFSLVNAIPYFAASILGAWISDPLTDRLGRRAALFAAGFCSFVAPIGSAYCTSWPQLLGCRILQGVGMGAKSSVVPVLESEVSPPGMRGKLLVSWQTFVAIGIFLGAGANCIFQGQWRHQLGIAFVPAIPLLCLCFVVRESPRWLVKKGRYREAFIALSDLRETPLQAARDLFLIHAQLSMEIRLFSGDDLKFDDYKQAPMTPDTVGSPVTFFRRVSELLTIPRNRRAALSSCIVMSAQQFCGFNVLGFLAATVFSNSGFTDMNALWLAFGIGGISAVSSASAYFTVEKFGRRTLLLTSLCAMFPFLLLSGHYLDIREGGSPSISSVIILIFIYVFAYSFGAGVVPFMYSSEVFPLVHREAGMSLAVSVNLGLAGVLALVVPLTVKFPLHGFKLLGAFAGLDAIAIIAVWFFVRAPAADKAKTLEEMTELFVIPSKEVCIYQLKMAGPFSIISRLFTGRSIREKIELQKWYYNKSAEANANGKSRE